MDCELHARIAGSPVASVRLMVLGVGWGEVGEKVQAAQKMAAMRVHPTY